AGAHVAMVIDPDGGIHLAYQDTQKNYLKYSYLTFNGTSFTIVKTVYVDALIGAGQHNSISIKDFDIGNDDYRPVITTYSSAFTGTPVSLRMAYPNNSLAGILSGANENTGAFTGDWEVIAIPAGTNPQAGQNFTETDGNGASLGKIHLGYNGSHLEEITYLDLN
ncbi:MAG: hypothetical protein KAH95_14050, partial [Spirochaetales bacterium]|nr:hypothetical protein [Spirochaetales bacterium]